MKIYFSMILTMMGASLLFYSMSPYFSALGLVIVSMSSCIMLVQTGMKFLALILLLVYMGGMLMVFMYSSALSADRFPTMSKMKEMIILCMFMFSWTMMLFKKNNWNKMENKKMSKLVSIEGASYLFSPSFLPFFIFTGYILLITLMAVLNMSQETESSTLRAL